MEISAIVKLMQHQSDEGFPDLTTDDEDKLLDSNEDEYGNEEI